MLHNFYLILNDSNILSDIRKLYRLIRIITGISYYSLFWTCFVVINIVRDFFKFNLNLCL